MAEKNLRNTVTFYETKSVKSSVFNFMMLKYYTYLLHF